MNAEPGKPLSTQHSGLSTVPWKRISKVMAWLLGFPPVGLWMLWRDQILSRSIKIRIVVYAVLIVILLSILFTLYEFGAAEKAIRAGGGGY
jgi:hypothetical protein